MSKARIAFISQRGISPIFEVSSDMSMRSLKDSLRMRLIPMQTAEGISYRRAARSGQFAETVKLVGIDQKRLLVEVRLRPNDADDYHTMSMAYNPYGDGNDAERITCVIAHITSQNRWLYKAVSGANNAS